MKNSTGPVRDLSKSVTRAMTNTKIVYAHGKVFQKSYKYGSEKNKLHYKNTGRHLRLPHVPDSNTSCSEDKGGVAQEWISFKRTLFVQVPATMKVDVLFRTKKCMSQESSLMYTRHKYIPVSKPISIK